ncbi:MAG: hypothetical protein WBF93_16570 [Pirellulales bacterium]
MNGRLIAVVKDHHAIHFAAIKGYPTTARTTAHRRVRFVVTIPRKFKARLTVASRWPVDATTLAP